MDRLGNIEAFVAAAELGNFTLAAARLKLSPSALSRRVAQLEDELGVRLFHRTTRAVRLSDEGSVFFERCRGALRELGEAHDSLSRLRGRPAGRLRIEAPTLLGRDVIVPAVAKLVARHPEVEPELVLRDSPGDLVSEGIDVAVRLGALDDSSLVVRRLGRTRMRVCAAPSYLRRKGTPRTVSALSRHECIVSAVHGQRIAWRLRDGATIREISPSGRVVANTGEALIGLAIAGTGLAWVCDFMMARAREAGQLVEVLADAACHEQPVQVLSLPSRHMLPKVRAFMDTLATELRRNDVES